MGAFAYFGGGKRSTGRSASARSEVERRRLGTARLLAGVQTVLISYDDLCPFVEGLLEYEKGESAHDWT